ncbi:hypothetical protein ACQ4LE_000499 [Meloidogyne hapla]
MSFDNNNYDSLNNSISDLPPPRPLKIRWPEQVDDRDCIIELDGQRKLGIQRLHELLISRFCFISGMKTPKGYPLLTFPDSRCCLSFENYQLLLDYLFQINREESDLTTEDNLTITRPEWIIIVDRRQDRWSSVKTILSFLVNYFPEPIHLIILLKPEGVLQRAIEYGYKSVLEGCEKFRPHICQSCSSLHEYIETDFLTMDLGGSVVHNHEDWTTYRIEIERMKSSARVIAESLGDFGKCLRETELPNDVQTTEKVLEMQQHERDAIKEDFRISIRKGLQLLRQVRQTDESSNIDQHPSPCSLQNVAAIERMIAQLQDTEKSFDTFWQKHRLRLISCLELRRFEDEFRKLQNSFAKHMLRLEEQRIELGNSESSASRLILEHRDYRADAMADVFAARTLKERGLMLAEKELTESLNTQGSDSVGPKCEELTRMADALEIALEQRTRALEISRQMHSQIGKANDWCRRGVELLSSSPLDLFSSNNSSFTFFEEALNYLEEFIKEGDNLKMDALMKQKNCGDSGCEMMVLTSSDTSSLIAQVNERIDDIRRLSNSRRDALRKMSVDRMATINHNQQQQQKPIQIVSPEKNKKESKQQQNNGKLQKGINNQTSSQRKHDKKEKNNKNISPIDSPTSSSSVSLPRANFPLKSCSPACSPIAGPMEKSLGGGKVNYVLEELLSTERTYVRELAEIIHHYIQPLEALEFTNNGTTTTNSHILPGQSDVLFGNIRELHDFHHSILLPSLHQNSNSVEGVSTVLSSQRHRLLSLYRLYCRNKPISEELRREHLIDQNKFILECQRRAGHLLPLSAYLLKPIQRITKYQLLLKELIRYCPDAGQSLQHVQTALTSMLDLLAQINADMEQLHILGYPGDLRLLGSLRLRTECDVSIYKRSKSASAGGGVNGGRRNGIKGKQQRRHLLLFDGGILFCKKRLQTPQPGCEYFEHKFCIPINSLGFAECSRFSDEKFEIWDINESGNSASCFAIHPLDEKVRPKWIHRLSKLTVLNQQQQQLVEAAALGMPDSSFYLQLRDEYGNNRTRPQSWTTTSSSEDGTTIHPQQICNKKNKANNNNSAAQSSRSSTSSSSAVIFEDSPTAMEDLNEAEITFRRHSDSSSSSNNSSSSNRKTELIPRSHSQPPELLQIEEINTKMNGGMQRIDRL